MQNQWKGFFNPLRKQLPAKWVTGITLIILSLSFFISSCQEKARHSPPSPEAKAIYNIIQQIDVINSDIEQKLIFKSLASADKIIITVLLADIRITLQYLALRPQEKSILKLFDLTQQLDGSLLPLRESSKLAPLITSLKQRIYALAKSVSLDLTGAPWTLYSYDFGGGLFPFSSFSNGSKWITDFSTTGDHTYASIKQGRQAIKSWLLSPGFDLTKAKSVFLQLRHSLNIGRAEDDFNRQEILNNSFKIYVFNDLDEQTPSRHLGTELSLSEWPGSTDFQVMNSPLVELTAFRGPNVQIGLLFNFNNHKHGFHFVKWQVNQFILKGQGLPPDFSSPKLIYFEEAFSQGLGDFKSWSATPTGETPPPQWRQFSCCGESRSFAVIHSQAKRPPNDATSLSKSWNDNSDENGPLETDVRSTWLVSPTLDWDPQESYDLEFTHGMRVQSKDATLTAKIKVLYVIAPLSELKHDLADITGWTELPFLNPEEVESLELNRWASFSPRIKLKPLPATLSSRLLKEMDLPGAKPEVNNQNSAPSSAENAQKLGLRIAFVFENSLTSRYSWQIEQFNLWRSKVEISQTSK